MHTLITSLTIYDNPVIFIEHYPLRKKEEELFQSLRLTEAKIYSSLDEPLFAHFGGYKIIAMMQKMGMHENESVQHSLVTSALKNAQEKIARKFHLNNLRVHRRSGFKRILSKIFKTIWNINSATLLLHPVL